MQELEYTPVECDVVFCVYLSDLLQECISEGVEIASIKAFQTGFSVMFKDVPGDAICHKNSYGHNFGLWETLDMPWSEQNRTVHTAEELAKMIAAAQNGRDWKQYVIA